jgi:hypothetical protein
MNYTPIIIIILLIITLFIMFYLYCGFYLKNICNNLEYFYYGESSPNNKTILILGGIHGNEPAGSKAILQLMNDINMNKIKIKNNRIILVPNVNYCALQLNKRLVPFIGDLNRKFPISKNYNKDNLNPIIKKILILMKQSDFIIDFHEGWGFYKDYTGSIGSTITPTNTIISKQVADLVYNKLNDKIKDYDKTFTILIDKSNESNINNNTDKYGKNEDIKHTLRYFANLTNENYILIETSGQNDVQDLDVRITQARTVIDTVLTYYNTY